MPRTPPIILPENPSESWFNVNIKKGLNDDLDLMRDHDLSSFTYSPSEDDEPSKSLQNSQREREHSQENEDNLYHKPVLNGSQNKNSNEHYELIDDEDILNSEQQQSASQDDDRKFDSAIEELKTDFKIYTDEYKEFKRHVDIAKRDLLEFIQNRTTYFEERGSYIYQKWELLRQLI